MFREGHRRTAPVSLMAQIWDILTTCSSTATSLLPSPQPPWPGPPTHPRGRLAAHLLGDNLPGLPQPPLTGDCRLGLGLPRADSGEGQGDRSLWGKWAGLLLLLRGAWVVVVVLVVVVVVRGEAVAVVVHAVPAVQAEEAEERPVVHGLFVGWGGSRWRRRRGVSSRHAPGDEPLRALRCIIPEASGVARLELPEMAGRLNMAGVVVVVVVAVGGGPNLPETTDVCYMAGWWWWWAGVKSAETTDVCYMAGRWWWWWAGVKSADTTDVCYMAG